MFAGFWRRTAKSRGRWELSAFRTGRCLLNSTNVAFFSVAVENGFVLAAGRQLIRPPDAPPLGRGDLSPSNKAHSTTFPSEAMLPCGRLAQAS